MAYDFSETVRDLVLPPKFVIKLLDQRRRSKPPDARLGGFNLRARKGAEARAVCLAQSRSSKTEL